jgi:TPR repeat protein
VIYALGLGVPRDLAQVTAWFPEAAEQGDPTAQVDLGLAYEKGDGVRKDKAEAEKWFTKADHRPSLCVTEHRPGPPP